MKYLPLYLIWFRFFLSPVMLFAAYVYDITAGQAIVLMLFMGLLSDIFDGIIARKAGVSSERLRRMDSQVDMIFWLSAGFSAWFIWPEVIRAHQLVIYSLLGMELTCYVVSIAKFSKETCSHAYLSKLWGLTLLAAFTDLIWNGNAGFLFFLCLGAGIVSHIDRILITLILPTWQHDIPSAYHAYRIRQNKPIRRFVLFNG